jgi:hypothetical protein
MSAVAQFPQTLIVYRRGDGKLVAYDTAYDDVAVREGIIRCVRTHGRGAEVRSMSAKEFARL